MSLESEKIKLANFLIDRYGVEKSEKKVEQLITHWQEVKKEIAKQKTNRNPCTLTWDKVNFGA